MRICTALLPAICFLLSTCSKKTEKTSDRYTEFMYGNYYNYYKKYDSAFIMFDRASQTTTDSLEKAMSFTYMGVIQRSAGDLFGAQESLTSALRALDTKKETHREQLAAVYNELGNTSLDLKNFTEAISFYDAAKAFTIGKDSILEIMNGKATALQKAGRYKDAIEIYDSILDIGPGNAPLKARAISNRARTKWLQDPNYPVLNEYRLALQIRIDSSDHRGQNASYAHLSDYYTKVQPDSALYYAGKMYDKAKEINSPDDVLESMDKLFRLNQSSSSKDHWYEEYRKLNDSIQVSRDTTRRQFALIKYDYQKSKADNLVLQQRVTRQRLFLIGGLAATTAILAGLMIWYRRRRQKLKQESEKTIKAFQLKASQKVHDVVANGLYRIMNEIEHGEEIEKEPLLNKIEGLYEKSRDISYELPLESNADYEKQIHTLLRSFANNHTQVIIVGNQPEFWNRIASIHKTELHFVLEELMINMQRHSHAKTVVIQFRQEGNKGVIQYKDNGVGFKPGNELGNGLKNTVSRIKSIHGQINFGKSNGEGVLIEISFPLQSH